MHFYKNIPSPVGKLTLIANDEALVAILWEDSNRDKVKYNQRVEKTSHPVLKKTEQQLKEYFDGKRKSFTIPIALKGTPFQKEVWNALQTIPYGKTTSYGELAKKIERPKACRAVGAANGRNPISIIIPCHRVIGANGSLTGFGGGLDRKEYLLSQEKKHK